MRFKIFLLLFVVIFTSWELSRKTIEDNAPAVNITHDVKTQIQSGFDTKTPLLPDNLIKEPASENCANTPDISGALDYVRRDMMAIRKSDSGSICVNYSQHFNVLLPSSGGFVLTRPSDKAGDSDLWRVDLAPVAWGTAEAMIPVGTVGSSMVGGTDPAMPSRLENRFGGGFTEWFVNSNAGLEQGFTIMSAPHGLDENNGKLSVSLKTTGGTVSVSPDSVGLRAEDGAQVVSYGKLLVNDASGRSLPARFISGADASSLSIEVDAAGASFPIIIDPLATSANWNASGEASGSCFGYSVATAGDVNGDGYGDIIIGAYGNNSWAGKAYVFHGSATGTTGTSASPAWSATGEAGGDYFGISVSTAGDVNGDGYCDVIIGAYGNGFSSGKVYVFHGSASGITGTAASPAWCAVGQNDGDLFGGAAATAGDVNGDGYCDIIVGALNFNNTVGKAYVFHGSASGITGTAAWSAVGELSGSYFGNSVATAGDVNGDGYGDVIIGAYQNSSSTGKAYVFHGSASGITGTVTSPAWSASGEKSLTYFGCSAATAGDVNGDGYSDVIIGAYGFDTNTGKAYVFHGSASGITGTSASPAWSAVGEVGGDSFGNSVSTAGDINGDGYSDVVIGAYQDSGNTGKAYFFYGSSSGITGISTSPDWSATGAISGSYFGISVSTAGDVNGDGYSDVIVGALGGTGKAYVFHGSASGISGTATSPAWSAMGQTAGDTFGISVASAGDVNGDSYNDIIVGAWGNTAFAGKAYVFYGSAFGITDTAISSAWSAVGEASGDWFGTSVSTAGDVNGDGYSDIIVGALRNTNTIGKVYVFHGSASGITGTVASPAWSAMGETSENYFGSSVATAGDVNGDGYSDVIVGAHGYDSSCGKTYVFHGSASGITGTSASPAWSTGGAEANDHFACSVATAGDVNRDGYSDIIVGAYKAYSGGGGSGFNGKAYVFHGSASGITGNIDTPAWSAYAEDSNDDERFGNSVATAGDVNGDGYSDVIVGAYGNNTYAGKAYVFQGSASGITGTSASPAWSAVGEAVGDYFGYSVSTAGDVNRDGYSDIIVGGPGSSSSQGNAYVFHGSASGITGTVSSPAWSAAGEASENRFSYSVACAGDVNGDGYSDIIVGTNSNFTSGKAYVFQGGGGGGLPINLKQLKADSSPMQKLGMSDSNTSFKISATTRSCVGRTKAKLQWEVKPLGSNFDGSGLGISSSWTDTTVDGATITETVSGLNGSTRYHWRARFVYSNPILSYSPWFSVGDNGWNETDFRTFPNKYTLTYNSGGNGHIDGTTPQTVFEGENGTQVTAAPDTNYHFASWTDMLFYTASRTDTNVTADITATANFEHDTAVLTIAVLGNGTTWPPPGDRTINTIDDSSITAFSNPDSYFSRWIPSGAYYSTSDVYSEKITLSLTGASTVTAKFKPYLFDLSDNIPDDDVFGDMGIVNRTVYRIDVPPNQTMLSFRIYDDEKGDGDCDLYVRKGEVPTTELYDFRSTESGNDEQIEISTPEAGYWYAIVYGYDDYADAKIVADFSNSLPPKPVLAASQEKFANKITLSWSSDNIATYYEIFRSAQNNSALAVKIGTSNTTDYVTSYEDSPFSTNTTYNFYYWVRGVTSQEIPGAFSNSVLGTTTEIQPVTLKNGTAVTGLSGAAGSVRKFKLLVDYDNVLLDVKTYGGTGDCGLELKSDPPTPDVHVFSDKVGTAENISLEKIDHGTYLINIFANTAYSGVSLMAKYSTPAAAPAAPSGVNASDGLFSDKIVVTWTASPGATSYLVGRNTVNNTTPGGNFRELGETADCIFEDNSPALLEDSPGTLFYYFVLGKNQTGSGNYSTGNSGYITKAPASPTTVTVSNGTYFDKILVTWPKVADATSYELYRSPSPTRTITNASIANPCVITVNAHAFSDGDIVLINGVGGTIGTLLNGKSLAVTVITDNTFSVPVTGSTTEKTYLSGGTATVETITGASAENPCVITVNDHGLTNGDTVLINGVVGTMATLLNGKSFPVKKITEDTFSIPANTLLKTYVSGGSVILASPIASIRYDSRLSTYSFIDMAYYLPANPNPDNTYYYWVRAVNVNDASPLKLSTTVGSIKKAGPTAVTATAGTLFGKVKISWTAVPGATGYDVYRYDDKACQNGMKKFADVADLFYYDTDAAVRTSATPYYYKVKAKFNTYYDSNFNPTAAAGYHKSMPGPSSVKASAGTYFGKVHVTWTAVSGATSYEVYRYTDKACQTEPTKFSDVADLFYNDTSTEAESSKVNAPLYYKVRAKFNEVPTLLSLTAAAGYYRNFAGPATITASAGTFFGKVRVTWSPVLGATSYELFRDGKTTDVTTAMTTYDDVPGDTDKHDYTVKAKDETYTGNPSNAATGYAYRGATIANLAAPKLTASKDMYNYVKLSWTEIPLAKNYLIYKNTTPDFATANPLPANPITDLSHNDAADPGVLCYYWIKANNDTVFPAKMSVQSAVAQGRAVGTTTAIADGDTVENLDGKKESCAYYSVYVPGGKTRLVATLTGTSSAPPNDCDVYVKLGSSPSTASYNAKGVKNSSGKTLTVSNPAEGTWYFMLYGVTDYSKVTLKVNCYAVADIVLTQVPANDQAVPFTAIFKGRVVDESGKTGIAGLSIQVRNPIPGITNWLPASWLPAKTDAAGYFTYSTTINSEGEHTFDFFFKDMPDTAKGTASHTVATKKGCLVESPNNFFDFSTYLPASPVTLTPPNDLLGMQTFLNIRQGWKDGAVDPDSTYERMWIDSTLVKSKDDAQLLEKLDEGLYMLFYGVEGAGAGNDTIANSALSAVPFVVHVASSEKLNVLANLKTLGLLDETQEIAIGESSIVIVAVASLSDPDEVTNGYNISLLAREQLEILANLAAGDAANVEVVENRKYAGTPAKVIKITLDSGREINVVSAVFVK